MIIRLNLEYILFLAWAGGFDEILVFDTEVPRNRMQYLTDKLTPQNFVIQYVVMPVYFHTDRVCHRLLRK